MIPALGLPAQAARERRCAAALHPAFPDGRGTIELLVAEGEVVVARDTWTATHTGVWDTTVRGVHMGVPPTGRQVLERGATFDRIEGGRIVEHWATWDWAGLAQHIGALPGPDQPRR